MTVRTTATAVNDVRAVEQDGDIDVILAPFIATANSLVTAICTSSSLSDENLELIERWLSAHFYSLSPEGKMTLSETVGPLTETFFGKIGYALNLTFYGQTAMLLDTSGALARWNNQVISGKTQTASVVWGGTART